MHPATTGAAAGAPDSFGTAGTQEQPLATTYLAPEGNVSEPRSLRFVRRYLQVLHRLRYPLLMTYVVLTIGLAFAAAGFPTDVSASIEPPTDSAAYIAKKEFAKYFAQLTTSEPTIILARSIGSPVDFATDVNYNLLDQALEYWSYTGEDPPDMIVIPKPVNKWVTASYASFRASINEGLAGPAYQYLAPGGYATYAMVGYSLDYKGPNGISATDYIKQMNDKIRQYLRFYGLANNVAMTPLGVSAFLIDISDATAGDMIILFGVVTPISLLIFAYTLRCVRILILPLTTLAVTTVLTFAFMHFVAMSMQVNSMAPGLAAAFCLMLSFSYSYTIAAKYVRETIDQMNFGDDRHLIVLELVMAYSGRTVFVSGMSIALCTMGLVFFPIEMLRSIGLSCLFASLSSVLVSLSVLPVILLCAPKFFANGVGSWIFPIFGSGHSTQVEAEENFMDHSAEPQTPIGGGQNGTNGHNGNGHRQPMDSTDALGGAADDGPSVLRATPRVAWSRHMPASTRGSRGYHQAGAASELSHHTVDSEISRLESQDARTRASYRVQRVRFFYKYFIAFMAQTPVAVVSIVVVLGLCMYPMTQAFSTEYSNDLSLFAPRNSDLLPAWDYMQRTFRGGQVFQYSMVVRFKDLPDGTPPIYMLNPAQFAQGHRLIQLMTEKLPSTQGHAFDAFFYNGVEEGTAYGGPVPLEFYMNCSRNITGPENQANFDWTIVNLQECFYKLIVSQIFVSISAGPATWVQIRPDFNPLSSHGMQWYHDFMRVKPDLEAATNTELFLSGYPAETIDLVNFSEDRFPTVVGIVSAIVFVSVCVLTVSLGIPLRGLLIVFVATATCFGMGNIIFVKSGFSWMPIDGLKGEEKSVVWLMPFATLLLIVGVSLHYDLSIVLRVKQFHHHGHETRAAIILAAQETGSEITVSACMTILLFSGLLFSQVPAMNQLGFYLMFAALLQGLLFRVFFSTTFMAVLGDWNWFPMNVIRPEATIPIDEDPLMVDCPRGTLDPNASMPGAIAAHNYQADPAQRSNGMLSRPQGSASRSGRPSARRSGQPPAPGRVAHYGSTTDKDVEAM